MTGTERRETVRLLPGEPGRRGLRRVEIDDPTLAVHRTDAARGVREARAVGVLEPAPPGDRYRS